MFEKIISLKNQELCFNVVFIVILAIVILYTLNKNNTVENMVDNSNIIEKIPIGEKKINKLNESINEMIGKLKKLEKNTCILTNNDMIKLLKQVRNISNKLMNPMKHFTSGMSKNLEKLNSSVKDLDLLSNYVEIILILKSIKGKIDKNNKINIKN